MIRQIDLIYMQIRRALEDRLIHTSEPECFLNCGEKCEERGRFPHEFLAESGPGGIGGIGRIQVHVQLF